jgi:hypothetical protein
MTGAERAFCGALRTRRLAPGLHYRLSNLRDVCGRDRLAFLESVEGSSLGEHAPKLLTSFQIAPR